MAESEKGRSSPGQAQVWPYWAKIKAQFPTWSLLPSTLYTPGALRFVGVDSLAGLRRNRSTIATCEILEAADEKTFDAVSALAALNARRQEQMLRGVVVGYLTIPVTGLALIAELAGDSLASFVRAEADSIVPLVLAAAAVPLTYALSWWRSRQIVAVLDLLRIERGLAPSAATDPGED